MLSVPITTDVLSLNLDLGEVSNIMWLVPITTSHKHLGVTFSNDAKWNTHVDNIQSIVYKHLNILRRLKYRLSRTNLDKLYLVYIRPLFEFACQLWDNCGTGNSQKLEQL
jgi:hypothetical protein